MIYDDEMSKKLWLSKRGATFHGRPCGECGGTLRYVNGQKQCVPCTRRENADRNALRNAKVKARRIVINSVRRGESW